MTHPTPDSLDESWLYNQDKAIAMAKEIYGAVYDVDSKAHRAETVEEIHCWLVDGDLTGAETFAKLVEWWREYDAAGNDDEEAE